ncbi:hypothetical protein, partial [Erwinia amylovora]|uniref:hypothetical protein n=1 Tax=Erwinia amylovora TaxID=552 RepID=UPI0020BD50D5
LFLNPDAVLKPGFFKTAIAFMADAANARVGIVGPAIENDDGTVAETCSNLPGPFTLIARSIGLDRGFLAAQHHAQGGHVGQVIGAVL